MEVKITDSNFEAEVKESSIPVLVDFYADWCGPCKMMAPLVAQLAESYSGKEADTIVGAVSKNELEKKIKQVLA